MTRFPAVAAFTAFASLAAGFGVVFGLLELIRP